MTKAEMQKLSNLLDALFASYPKEKRPSGNADIFLAYQMALEPYEYEPVKNAVFDHARDSRMFPSVAEIVQHLPKIEPKEKHIPKSKLKPFVDAFTKHCDSKMSVSRYAREHGISWEEARAEMERKTHDNIYDSRLPCR